MGSLRVSYLSMNILLAEHLRQENWQKSNAYMSTMVQGQQNGYQVSIYSSDGSFTTAGTYP
jgi:hypothetical protein